MPKNDSLLIRKASKSDIDNGLLDALSEFGPTDWTARNQKAFSSRQSCLWMTTFVAESNGKVVGTASCFVEPKLLHSGCWAGHIEDVAVVPEYQGCGVGRALMEAALAHLKEAGCYKATLDCDKGKVGFYEKFGFYLNGEAMRVDLCLSEEQ